jgi:hypothetical protein
MFKTFKTRFIFGIILLSLFVVFIPSVSAGFINVPPLINVTYPVQKENLVPNSGVLDIPLSIDFTLTGPFAKIVEQRSKFKEKALEIELKIVKTEDWCTAKISNPDVKLTLQHTEPFKSRLTVAVTEEAQAFTQSVVTISATSKMQRGIIFNIAEETAEFDVSFIIGYWSDVSYHLPEGTTAEIGPYDTAHFPIDIENNGNGATFVKIELLDYPKEKWAIDIDSNVSLSSPINTGEYTSKTVNLRIKPKMSPDWNKETKTFGVKFTPWYLGMPDLKGQEEIIYFNVQKIGSLNNLEETENNFIIMIITVIILVIIISIIIRRKYLR